MRPIYLNFARMFDFQCLDYKCDNLIIFLQMISNIQLVQLLQLNNHNNFKYNEISQVIQFVSISGNTDPFQNQWIIYFFLTSHVILMIFMIQYTLTSRIGILRHIQYAILVYCTILEFPIISIMIQCFQNYEDFKETLIICIAAINLFFYIVIQIIQQVLGKSFSIQINNNYTPGFDVSLNSFIRFYRLFIICLAYALEVKLFNFALLTAFQLLLFYQQFKFISVKSFNFVQICCIQMVCIIIYFSISIVWSLILMMLTIGISAQYHQFLYYNLISNQSTSEQNIAYVCSQLAFENRSNLIEQFFIFQNHKCLKCKEMSDICACILKKIKLNQEQDRRKNLLYCNKISDAHPIKSLINLTRFSYNLRIDYQIRFTSKISDLIQYINKRQFLNEQQDETKSLTVSQIRQSVKLCQQTLIQFTNIIKEQVLFWKKAQQGFQNYQQCLIWIKKLGNLMIENKQHIGDLMQIKNLNIIELKILQIHYAVVYLDQQKIYSYQKQIDDKLLQDRYKLDKNVNNKVLFEGRYLLVQTSLVFNKGQLINFKQQNYNQFYNLPYDQPNQIERIEDLMPSFKRSTHNKFLDNYIRKGYSSFDKSGLGIFICTPEDYIIMATLQVNFDNSIMNDVVLTGLITKEQNINKAILISLDGQILGMDKGTFDIIRNNLKAQVDITKLVNRGYFIQSFIKNIQKSIDLLNQKVKMQNEFQLTNINDQWVSQTYFNQYEQSIKQINEQQEKIKKSTILMFNQNYSETDIGTSIIYNLYFIRHYHKDGEMCYFKIIIIDQNDDFYKKCLSNQSNSNNSKESQNRSYEPQQGNKDNRISIQVSQLNQKYKFFSQLLSQNQQLDIINEDHSHQNENIAIQTPRYQEDSLIKQVQDYKQNKIIKERHAEQSMTSQRSSEDSLYLAIINNLYGQNKIAKQLSKISFILALTFVYLIAIIFTNPSQIQKSVDNQLTQIELLRKPQNITYVYTSLSNQLLFKYANQKGIVQLSPFMIYWNHVQQIYMQKYIESLIVSLNIQVPIIANSFNKDTTAQHFFINDQQFEIEVSLPQFYDRIVQYFQLLRDDDQFQENMITFMNKGFLRENIIKLLQLNDYLLKQINIIITNLQQSEINTFLIFIMIQLIILMVFYVIQLVWWKQIDKIMVELVLIIHRTKFSQIEKQIENLQMISSILQIDDGSWMQSPISNIILDSEQMDSSGRKQQLISMMPQDQYISRSNFIICFSILIINMLFNITGYLIYYQQNIVFQKSLSAMSNYVQFLHDTDCSFLFAGFIKLDGPLNGDQTYLIDQEEIVKALNKTSNQLLPQLENLQHMIYSSSLQENQLFYQLLFQNLCETSSQQLVMCDSSTIEQEYWEKDNYNYLISNGIIGFTNQFIKFVTENYQYEFQTLQYTSIEQSKQIIDQPIFQNLFLQYFLDLQETLRIFLKTFQKQNTKMGQDIVSLLQGYYIGFGMFFVLMSGIAYYYWVKHNQYQIYLALQIIGIIPNSHVISQNFKSQVLKLYKSIY